MASELERLIIGVAAASILGGIFFGRWGVLVGAACASILLGTDTSGRIAAGYDAALSAPGARLQAFRDGMTTYLPNNPQRAVSAYQHAIARNSAVELSRRQALEAMAASTRGRLDAITAITG